MRKRGSFNVFWPAAVLCFVALFVHRKLDTPFFSPFNSFLFVSSFRLRLTRNREWWQRALRLARRKLWCPVWKEGEYRRGGKVRRHVKEIFLKTLGYLVLYSLDSDWEEINS